MTPTPKVGATVRHPLWPELGTGRVATTSGQIVSGQRVGWIHWSCGQISRHNLSVLRQVADPPEVQTSVWNHP